MLCHLNILANLILNTYFKETGCILIFKDSSSNFIYNGEFPFVTFKLNKSIIKEELVFNNFGCQGIVISTENPVKVFENLENVMRLNHERFNIRRYLFLPVYSFGSAVSDVFNSNALNNVADLLIIETNNNLVNVQDTAFKNHYKNKLFYLFTHKYVGNVNSNEKILLDIWFAKNLSFMYFNNLFPDKLTNQMGRQLRIATFTYKPYAIPVDPGYKSDGTEVRISLEFSKKYNMTPVMVVDEVGQWGIVYDNWTGDGIIGNLAMDKADVGLGALYTWQHESLFLDLSKPAVRTGITCVVPAPTLATGWLTPLFSFSNYMWFGVFISYILSSTSVFFINMIRKNNETIFKVKQSTVKKSAADTFQISFLTIWGSFLLQSLPRPMQPYDKVSKCLFGFIFLLTLLLATSYSSGLASSMTIPRYVGAIHSVHDLSKSDVKWGATSDAWIMSIMEEKQPDYVKLLQNFVIANETVLRELGKGRFAFSIERLPGGMLVYEQLSTQNQSILWAFYL